MIIDHKSAPLQSKHCAARAATFAGQLGAYKEMPNIAGEEVTAAWVHFPLAGVLTQID